MTKTLLPSTRLNFRIHNQRPVEVNHDPYFSNLQDINPLHFHQPRLQSQSHHTSCEITKPAPAPPRGRPWNLFNVSNIALATVINAGGKTSREPRAPVSQSEHECVPLFGSCVSANDFHALAARHGTAREAPSIIYVAFKCGGALVPANLGNGADKVATLRSW